MSTGMHIYMDISYISVANSFVFLLFCLDFGRVLSNHGGFCNCIKLLVQGWHQQV